MKDRSGSGGRERPGAEEVESPAERVLQLGLLVLLLAALLLQVGAPESYQFVIAVVAGCLSLGALSLSRLAPPPAPLAACALWCLYPAVHSLLFAPSGYLARASLARRGIQASVLVVAMAAATHPAGLRVFRAGVVLSAGVASASAIADRLEGVEAKAHWMGIPTPGEKPRARRVAGLFANPNLLGGFLALCLPVCAGLALKAGPVPVTIACASSALVGAGLGLSYSRSSWLVALAGALALLALSRARNRLAPPLVFAALALMVAAPGAAQRALSTTDPANFGISQRLALVQGVTGMMLAAPVLGFGSGTFHTAYPMHRVVGGQYPFDAHGQFFQEAVETGAPGLGMLLLLIASSFAVMRRLRVDPHVETRQDCYAALVAGAVLSLFASPLHYTPLAVLLMALLGVAAAPSPARGREARRPEEPSKGQGTLWILRAAAIFAMAGLFTVFWAADARSTARAGVKALRAIPDGPGRAEAAKELARGIREAIQTAEARDPGAPEHPYLEARLLEALGFYEEAEDQYHLTRARNPYEGLAWQGVARSRERRGDMVGALKAMDEALRLDPYAEAALHQKARLLIAAGEMEAAEETLRRALRTNEAFLRVNRSTYPKIMLELIRLLEGLGRLDEAQGWREHFLDLYGDA